MAHCCSSVLLFSSEASAPTTFTSIKKITIKIENDRESRNNAWVFYVGVSMA
jgi:hypothetical protein